MKVNFKNFLQENPNCSKFEDNEDAEAIFNILLKELNILKMIEFSEFQKPALAACVNEIEEFFDKLQSPKINLADDFTKKAIGMMIKTILKNYEYEVSNQKDLPKSCKSKYFSSASCYIKSQNAQKNRFIIEDDILAIKKGTNVYNNLHLEIIIKFNDDDNYKTTKVSINEKSYDLNIKYPFRSQGNIHLIFFSESGFFASISLDGHKGDMFVNRNKIIDYLVKYLNIKQKNSELLLYKIDSSEIYEVLKNYSDINIL